MCPRTGEQNLGSTSSQANGFPHQQVSLSRQKTHEAPTSIGKPGLKEPREPRIGRFWVPKITPITRGIDIFTNNARLTQTLSNESLRKTHGMISAAIASRQHAALTIPKSLNAYSIVLYAKLATGHCAENPQGDHTERQIWTISIKRQD